jgi:isopenicillin N synthase-like dioxygenase
MERSRDGHGSGAHGSGNGMESIPIIDIAGLRDGSAATVREIATEIGAAARSIGFFMVRNHGIAPELTQRLFAAGATFFALPQDEKDVVSKSAAGRRYVGYAAPAADYKETFHVMREFGDDVADALDGQPLLERNLWPALPGFRDVVTAYYEAVLDVAIGLHRALAIDVGADAEEFVRSFEHPLAGFAINHYPPQPSGFEGIRWGAAAHTDWGGFTLLAQDDIAGLEVRRRDGTWIAVDPVPGTLVCNIGDALMRWTNDVYVSNPHRVVNRSRRSRYSAAFFCDPSADTRIVPLPACVSADRPAKYPEIAFADMIQARIEARKAAAARALEAVG